MSTNAFSFAAFTAATSTSPSLAISVTFSFPFVSMRATCSSPAVRRSALIASISASNPSTIPWISCFAFAFCLSANSCVCFFTSSIDEDCWRRTASKAACFASATASSASAVAALTSPGNLPATSSTAFLAFLAASSDSAALFACPEAASI